MLKITILTAVKEEPATSKKNTVYTKRTQEAIFETDDMKQKFDMSVNEKGIPLGVYNVEPQSMFAAGKYGPELRFQSDWKLVSASSSK